MPDICYPVIVDDLSCVQCDAVAPVVAQPARTIYNPIFGWNGSARSIARIVGDVFVQFSAPPCVGTVTGLAAAHLGSDPRYVPYGFYIRKEAGAEYWSVVEAGDEVTTKVLRNVETDVFRIERRNGRVYYFHNGRAVYRSTVETVEALQVVCCLYASGDGVY